MTRSVFQRMSAGLPTSRFDGTPIYIYAFVSPSGALVYIGRTYDPGTRIGAHRVNAEWWTPDLSWALIDIAHSWDEAKRLEALAIRSYSPVANVMHNQKAVA